MVLEKNKIISKNAGAAVAASAQLPNARNARNAGSSDPSVNNTTELTGEEEDNLSKSNKKIKEGTTGDEHMKETTPMTTMLQITPSHTHGQVSNNELSYRDSLMTFSGAQQDQPGKEGTTWETLNLDIIEDIDNEIVEEGGEEDPTNPVITASKEERIEWSKPWSGSLIIKLMGRRIGFKILYTKLQRLWNPKGDMKITDMNNDYFLVQFALCRGYLYALEEGPWLIFDHYLVVQCWRPDFDPFEDKFNNLAV
ncbi:uncharacterized protein G2W53_018354 [Senna tora]|uniref:DUF4283 domain-containing protein n=1 Tax=Senna tora TaxID=362788 RepID=A0A834TRM7_9FABA|nr:uncharacterized protein G2W53_018354 [Senna tora]